MLLAILLCAASSMGLSGAALALAVRTRAKTSVVDAVDDGIALAERMGTLSARGMGRMDSADKLTIAMQHAQGERPKESPARLRKLIEIRLQKAQPSKVKA